MGVWSWFVCFWLLVFSCFMFAASWDGNIFAEQLIWKLQIICISSSFFRGWDRVTFVFCMFRKYLAEIRSFLIFCCVVRWVYFRWTIDLLGAFFSCFPPFLEAEIQVSFVILWKMQQINGCFYLYQLVFSIYLLHHIPNFLINN